MAPKASLFFILSCILCVSAFFRPVPQDVQYSDPEDWLNNTYTQKIDHFNESSRGTYAQRYWRYNDSSINTTDDFNMLYICGEYTCDPTKLRTGPINYAKARGGKIWALEHRYYGESQVLYRYGAGWTTANMKWLSAELALADMNAFIGYANGLQNKTKANWLVVGGSYPGALAGWFQHVYPGVATAAWASSGVINAIQDYTMYDWDLYDASSKSGADCPKNIAMITADIERIIQVNDTRRDNLTQKLVGKSYHGFFPEVGDFMYYVADIFASAIQYENRTGLCQMVLSDGWKEDPIQCLHDFAYEIGVFVDDYDATGTVRNLLIRSDVAIRQWTWQYCTEWGFFQEPNAVYPLRSPRLTHDWFLGYCRRVFGDDVPLPHTAAVNYMFGGLNNNGTNIVFNNAIEDPWQYAGMRKVHNPAVQTSIVTNLIDCTDCAHCVDMLPDAATDAPELTQARQATWAQLDAWLGVSPKQEKQEMFMQD